MNLLRACRDPNVFGTVFAKRESWSAWFAFLAALTGQTMTRDQLMIFRQCTGRTHAPTERADEAWLVCGRRSGKSFMLALVAVYAAAFKDWRPYLGPGERGTVMVVAGDRKQART